MRRLIALFLLSLLAPLAATAQDSRKYAVLSLVGDKLLNVTREMSTGSRLDKNDRAFVELPDNSIDRAVTIAVDDALCRANPGSQPILLHSRRADLYEASFQSMDRRDGVARVYAAVKPIVEKTGATHLVLVTNHGTMARGVDTNDAEAGFIAPFSYMMISLIDLKTGQILSQQHAIGSNATSPRPWERNVGNAWQRLDEKEKVARLTEVIREETARTVPMVLARR